jgi:hypothetical protein
MGEIYGLGLYNRLVYIKHIILNFLVFYLKHLKSNNILITSTVVFLFVSLIYLGLHQGLSLNHVYIHHCQTIQPIFTCGVS